MSLASVTYLFTYPQMTTARLATNFMKEVCLVLREKTRRLGRLTFGSSELELELADVFHFNVRNPRVRLTRQRFCK